MENILRCDAKRYYLHHFDNFTPSYAQAVQVVEREYNSIITQERAKTYLSSVRANIFVKEGMDELNALEKVYKLIVKLSPQVSVSHRGEAHKIELLRKATVVHGWYRETLNRVNTNLLQFQLAYGEMESTLHLEREGKTAIVRDKASFGVDIIGNESSSTPKICYQGQGQYLNSHRGVRDRNKFKKSKHTDPLLIIRFLIVVTLTT